VPLPHEVDDVQANTDSCVDRASWNCKG